MMYKQLLIIAGLALGSTFAHAQGTTTTIAATHAHAVAAHEHASAATRR